MFVYPWGKGQNIEEEKGGGWREGSYQEEGDRTGRRHEGMEAGRGI